MALKFLNNGYFAGKVGIGTQTPLRGDLVVKGDFQTVSSGNGQLAIISGVLGSNPSDADVGGQMVFGGPISSSDSNRTFGLVGGYKENNTSGDRAGYLSFGTRQNTGSRDIFERMRIDSSGIIYFSKTDNTSHIVATINHASNNFLYVSGGTGGASFGDDGQNTRMLAFDNDFLRFDTAGSEKMRITSDGDVGIGTDIPDRRLHVKDAAIVVSEFEGTNVGALMDLVNSNASPSYNGIRFTQGTSSKMAITHIADGTTKGYVQIGNSWATGSEILVVDGRTSNVGIGTTSPGEKLEVNGNIKLSSTAGQTATPSNIWLGNDYSNGTTRDKLKIYLYNSGTEQYGFTVGNQSDIQYHSNQKHDFYVANSLKVRINQSGDVGIGTTNPNAKLTIWDGGATFDARTSGINVHRPNSYGQYGSFSYDGAATHFASTYTGNAALGYGTFVFKQYNNGTVGRNALEIQNDGNFVFNQYAGSALTGTPTYVLGTDASGNVVKVLGGDIPGGGGTVTGTGTTGRLTKFTDGPNGVIGDSGISDSSNALAITINGNEEVGIGQPTPFRKLHVNSGTTNVVARFESTDTTAAIEFKDNNGSAEVGNTGDNLVFFPAGAEKMRIDSNGNVGIGTTNPDSPLEVQFAEANGTSKEMLHLDYNPTDNYGSAIFKISSGGSANNFFEIEQVTGGGAGDFGTYVDTNIINRNASSGAYGNINFITGSSTSASSIVMTIGGGTQKGNVGIGTASPTGYRLVVENTSEDLLKLHNSTDGLDSLISFTNPGGTLGRIQGIDNGGLGFDVGNNAGGIVSNAMFIKNNGNVGIGTTSPSSQLNVHKNALSPAIIELSNTVVSGNDGVVVAQIKANTVNEELTRIETQNSSNSHDNGNLLFYNRNGYTNTFAESMRITGEGDVGIGTSNPSSKLEIAGKATSTSTVSTDAATTLVTKDYVDSSAGNPSYFRQGHKSHGLTNAFTTCLTVNLNSHTGCYVTVCCFGDWGSHSSAAYRGEFFLQNGANAYSEPGIILRQDDNTSNGADQIVCQILDPTSSSNPKDFEIQIRTTATTGTTGFTGLITFTVQGKFNSVT